MRSILLALAALFAMTSPAHGNAPAPPSATSAASLFVELIVNGAGAGGIVPLTVDGGRLLVAASDLRAAGMLIEGDRTIDLATLDGVRAAYDAPSQQLLIDADTRLLPVNRLAVDRRTHTPSIASMGALMNYDLYAQRAAGRTTLSAWTEQRVFGPFGIVTNNGVLRSTLGDEMSARPRYLRYDTFYRYVDEGRSLTFTAGDLITRSLVWSTSVRMGGIQIGRDYRVRPDLYTAPLPVFAGEAAVPSTVDLFVNGARQQGAEVAPGRFVLENMPVVSGGGEATIITTDAVGRQVQTIIPFYVAPELLRPGLVDFSAEAGFLRRGIGLRSFGYRTALVSGSARVGVTDRLTLEAHGEASRHVSVAGIGGSWAPGLWGVVSLSAAASTAGGRSGRQTTIGYAYTGRRIGFQAQHSERTGGFRDVGLFDLATYRGTQRSDRVLVSVALARGGSLGAAYLDHRTRGLPRAQILTLSYGRPLGAATLFVGADHDFRRGAISAQLRVTLPFGRSGVSAGVNRSAGRATTMQADYSRALSADGGLGVNAGVAANGAGDVFGQASAIWRGDRVQAEAGGAFADGRGSVWAGATGSIVAMDGSLFAANVVTDAFALVATDGVADVPVYFENQVLGRTDRRGHLLVPQVTAYHASRYAIDPLSLAIGDTFSAVERDASLRQGAGAVIRMPIERARAVTVTLVDDGGRPLEAGGVALLGDGARAAIGWDGVVYLPQVGEAIDLSVVRRDGAHCRAVMPLPAALPPLAQIGPVPCR